MSKKPREIGRVQREFRTLPRIYLGLSHEEGSCMQSELSSSIGLTVLIAMRGFLVLPGHFGTAVSGLKTYGVRSKVRAGSVGTVTLVLVDFLFCDSLLRTQEEKEKGHIKWNNCTRTTWVLKVKGMFRP